MKVTPLLQVLLFTLVINPAAHALDLIETLTRAEKYDALLQVALADYMAVQETSGISESVLLPQISFNAFIAENSIKITKSSTLPNSDSDFSTDGFSLSLDQVIYNQQVWDTLDQSNALIAQAAANYESARQALIIRAATTYFVVLGAQDNLEFSRAEKESAEQQREQSKERFNVGLIAITDVHEAQANYDSAVAREILAVNTLYNSKEALRVIIDDPLGELKPLIEEFPLKNPDPDDIKQWQNRALTENLDLKATMSGLRAAKDGYDSSRAGHYPTVNLRANYSSNSADGNSLGLGGRDTDSTNITLSLTVPLYEGGLTNARTRKSAAEVDRAQALLDQQRRVTIQEIRTAYLGVQTAISSVNAYKQALKSSRTALQATQAGFDVGTRTSVDVLIVEGSLYDSERNYARSKYDYLLAVLELKRAAGSLSAMDIRNINQWLVH
jgi:outer membrane protein